MIGEGVPDRVRRGVDRAPLSELEEEGERGGGAPALSVKRIAGSVAFDAAAGSATAGDGPAA